MTPMNAPVVAAIPPQTVAAAGSATSGWVAANTAETWIARCLGGALGSPTSVTFTLQQATDSSGTSAKALGSQSVVLTTNSTYGDIQDVTERLDVANGFTYVAVKVAVVGGTGALVAASLHAADQRYSGTSV